MTIILDIKPETETQLALQAAALGVEIETYVATLLEDAASHFSSPPTNGSARAGAKDMVELFAPLRGLDLDFQRDRDACREIKL